MPAAPHAQPVNRWRKTKKVTSVAGAVVGGAEPGAHTAIGAVAIFGSAAAASAAGIILPVVSFAGPIAAVAVPVASAMSLRSAWKSHRHARALKALRERQDGAACTLVDGDSRDDHGHALMSEVLDYCIDQKSEKTLRRGVGAVPGIGVLETGYAAARKVGKWWTGSLGQRRAAMAETLAEHLLTHNCFLAQAIVSELYSVEEMLWMLGQDFDVVAPLLAGKMKSR